MADRLRHLAGFCAALACGTAFAQSAPAYPRKPVALVVPFPPGAATDAFGRAAAARMGELLGQQFVVENRSGASGRIGTQHVARAAPDGHVLLWGSSGPLVISPVWGQGAPYDTLRDFAPVSLFAKIPFILVVHPSVPARSLRELLALVRANPGKLTYASSGTGGTSHLAGELFKSTGKLDILHVPYKGTALFAVDLVGGQVDLAFAGPTTVLPHVRTGRMRPLAITSTQRSELVPEVPTMAEAGMPGYEFAQWYGLLAPARTPGDIVATLNRALHESMKSPAVRKRVVAEGGAFSPMSPEQTRAFLQAELGKNEKMIRAAGLKRD